MSSELDVPLIRRIQSATGHLQGVERMIQDGEPCEQVVHQLIAVQGALRAVEWMLVKRQLECNLEVLFQSDSVQERMHAAKQVSLLYQVLSK